VVLCGFLLSAYKRRDCKCESREFMETCKREYNTKKGGGMSRTGSCAPWAAVPVRGTGRLSVVDGAAWKNCICFSNVRVRGEEGGIQIWKRLQAL